MAGDAASVDAPPLVPPEVADAAPQASRPPVLAGGGTGAGDPAAAADSRALAGAGDPTIGEPLAAPGAADICCRSITPSHCSKSFCSFPRLCSRSICRCSISALSSLSCANASLYTDFSFSIISCGEQRTPRVKSTVRVRPQRARRGGSSRKQQAGGEECCLTDLCSLLLGVWCLLGLPVVRETPHGALNTALLYQSLQLRYPLLVAVDLCAHGLCQFVFLLQERLVLFDHLVFPVALSEELKRLVPVLKRNKTSAPSLQGPPPLPSCTNCPPVVLIPCHNGAASTPRRPFSYGPTSHLEELRIGKDVDEVLRALSLE